VGAYYAHPGNRFWRKLYDIGLTSREFRPHEYRELLEFGIGFTDMSKIASGMDPALTPHSSTAGSSARKSVDSSPERSPSLEKKAASAWFGLRTGQIALGRHKNKAPGFPEVFVLSSPSGAATRYWNLDPWHELANWLRATNS
jgi:TDG/mug DNA glycosylase family protein